MPGAVFLRGDRVTLRTIERDADLDLFWRVYNDPDFREGLLFRTPQNREQVESLIEAADEEENRIDLLVCVNDDPIGAVRLFDIRYNDHGTLSYWLLSEYRGEGYATEAASLLCDHAFSTLGLHRVGAWTIAYNEASQALLDRLGFTHEGTFREQIFRKGEYQDTERYGLLTTEWDASDVILDDPS